MPRYNPNHPLFKTTWCEFVVRSHDCRFGEWCNHAHSWRDLRHPGAWVAPALAAPAAPAPAAPYPAAGDDEPAANPDGAVMVSLPLMMMSPAAPSPTTYAIHDGSDESDGAIDLDLEGIYSDNWANIDPGPAPEPGPATEPAPEPVPLSCIIEHSETAKSDASSDFSYDSGPLGAHGSYEYYLMEGVRRPSEHRSLK